MKTLAISLFALVLTGCQIETLYLYDDPVYIPQGLEIEYSNAHALSGVIPHLEQLSLLPLEIAKNPDEFLNGSGAIIAVSPLLELINQLGDSFFPWYDWQDINCSFIVSDSYGNVTQDYWQQQGEITGTWDAQECFSDSYNGVLFHGNIVSHSDWVSNIYGTPDWLSGQTKVDWLFQSDHGQIDLVTSNFNIESDYWGGYIVDYNLLFDIATDDQHGLLTVRTIESLIFEPGDTYATDGWVQFKSDFHKLDVYMMSGGLRIFLDGHWFANYSY